VKSVPRPKIDTMMRGFCRRRLFLGC